ncbi:GGDEF domain-containing protein [Methylococcus geothermalis]|uniref:diguanylate cyclase n=1 Tax=Methylococcus geothermalis TaxID=2681310 RepID=A0A858Q9K9_9GAMM|nr:diguanylate cyclase [Methylococcus geothermalis]QJD30588.1 diguanylate cyclase [Methylococcus geothermalis]
MTDNEQVLRAEIARLNEIIDIIMDRVENNPNLRPTSYFGLFQGKIVLENQVRQRTPELGAALREIEKINRVLKESEAKFRAVLDQSLVGILITERVRDEKAMRGSDMGCRCGGEEFVLVCPRMPLAKAAERAEHLRKSCAAVPFDRGDAVLQVTASFGVTGDLLIRSADGALYAAQKAGRNRVECHADTESGEFT